MSTFQSGLSTFGLSQIVAMPLTGWILDKVGARKVALISLTLFGVLFMSLALFRGDPWLFRLLWLMIALGGSGTMPIVWSRVIVSWFDQARGLALGLVLLGSGAAAVITPPLTLLVMRHFGWRGAYVVLGALPLLALVPNALFLKERKATLEDHHDLEGLTVSQALRGYRFWVLSLALLCVTSTVTGIIANLSRIMTTSGYAAEQAAGVAAGLGLFILVGRPICGWLMDRFWAPAVASVLVAGLPVACLLLRLQGLSPPLLIPLSMAIGMGAAAEIDIVPYLVSRYFGAVKFGRITGLILVTFSIGAALGPVAQGAAFDAAGNYRQGLLIAACVSAVAPLLLLSLGRYAFPPAKAKAAVASA
jgi:MFS family permease